MSKKLTPTVDDVRLLVEKWAPKFGFGGYRFSIGELPKSAKDYWGKSVWLHDDDHFEIRVNLGRLPRSQMEALVIHELTHGLVTYAARGQGNEESVCNRIPRLLLGDEVQTPNVWALDRTPPSQWGGDDLTLDLDGATVDPLVRAAMPLLVDGLPPREQDLVNAVYWEGVSLMEVARRLGISRRTAGRLHRQAMGHLRTLVEELEEAVDES